GIVGKQTRNGGFVSFYLAESGFDGGTFIRGIFKFDNYQRNTVDKENNIRAFVYAIFYHRKLVGNNKVVVFGCVEIYQPYQIASLLSVFLVADFNAFGQQAMKAFIIGQ